MSSIHPSVRRPETSDPSAGNMTTCGAKLLLHLQPRPSIIRTSHVSNRVCVVAHAVHVTSRFTDGSVSVLGPSSGLFVCEKSRDATIKRVLVTVNSADLSAARRRINGLSSNLNKYLRVQYIPQKRKEEITCHKLLSQSPKVEVCRSAKFTIHQLFNK